MIRLDVVVATLEAFVIALRPDLARYCGSRTGPVRVMATSRKWSAL